MFNTQEVIEDASERRKQKVYLAPIVTSQQRGKHSYRGIGNHFINKLVINVTTVRRQQHQKGSFKDI